jgi:uncharacterized membrane protein YccF (DUF307 family)
VAVGRGFGYGERISVDVVIVLLIVCVPTELALFFIAVFALGAGRDYWKKLVLLVKLDCLQGHQFLLLRLVLMLAYGLRTFLAHAFISAIRGLGRQAF